MIADAASVIAQSREDRLAELAAAAEWEQARADALDALVVLIASAPVPVARYAAVWAGVGRRLHLDAIEARRRAARAGDRLADVRYARDARAAQQ